MERPGPYTSLGGGVKKILIKFTTSPEAQEKKKKKKD